MSHKLEVKNLYKTFDDKKILNNINFYIDQGEFVSVLGPSGCGKTTLLRIIIGLEKADEGTVTVDGTDVTLFSPSKRKMGIVFQNYALFENMTVLRNVEYALLCAKKGKKQAREISMALIEQMHLSDKINKYPSELSGGQAQRVAIARTLALSPEIILFD
ncbi:MAG: ATP-binding cassette domain-containing protein, partial [Sphaerochaetaceae bacterium]|nr:ATP-binding cassette domain-containing protein [Sphaerochaetaceae bacterium]